MKIFESKITVSVYQLSDLSLVMACVNITPESLIEAFNRLCHKELGCQSLMNLPMKASASSTFIVLKYEVSTSAV
jgi:hypothetical protein